MDEEASIQDFLIKRHKWDKVSKKHVLIELLSCLEVDFNYHEPIVQKSMADTRGRDACKPDRLVLTATASLRTGIQGQSMLVSFNPLCSGEQKHICQTTKQPQHARLRISGCHYHVFDFDGAHRWPFASPSMNATRRRLTTCLQL